MVATSRKVHTNMCAFNADHPSTTKPPPCAHSNGGSANKTIHHPDLLDCTQVHYSLAISLVMHTITTIVIPILDFCAGIAWEWDWANSINVVPWWAWTYSSAHTSEYATQKIQMQLKFLEMSPGLLNLSLAMARASGVVPPALIVSIKWCSVMENTASNYTDVRYRCIPVALYDIEWNWSSFFTQLTALSKSTSYLWRNICLQSQW